MNYLNENLIRQEYNFLNDMVHVNTCSVGIPPLRTQIAAKKFMEKDFLPMAFDSARVNFGGLRQTVREQLARLLHASPKEIAFTKNTTEGTMFLAQGYDLKPGDNVVICDLEISSNLYPWIQASQQRGFTLRVLKTNGRMITTDQYLEAIDEHTKVVSVSVVQAHSGIRVDLFRLSRFCHERNVILAVDAIQALGRLEVDVQACGIDYLSCGGFKGLLSGFGIGFIYCRNSLVSRIIPMSADENTVELPALQNRTSIQEIPFVFLHNAERFEYGSMNTQGILLMHHSLSLLEDLGVKNVEAHILAREAELRQQLSGTRLDILPSGELPSGMLVAYYPEQCSEQVELLLNTEGIRMTHRPGYLRLSIGVHNTTQDMVRIANTFQKIAQLS